MKWPKFEISKVYTSRLQRYRDQQIQVFEIKRDNCWQNSILINVGQFFKYCSSIHILFKSNFVFINYVKCVSKVLFLHLTYLLTFSFLN